MNYVYPKLSEKDLYITRLGGAGLGNLLFVYAKALAISKKYNIPLIFPTWNTIKIGPILRREKDKRFYLKIFKNKSGHISGIKKIKLLLTKNKINFDEINEKDIFKLENKIIQVNFKKIEFNNNLFSYFKDYQKEIKEDLTKNLAVELEETDLSNSIVVNIRYGDFIKAPYEDILKGKDNVRIPIIWYVNVVKRIRNIVGKNVKVYVSSDGTIEELKPLLELENVEMLYFKNSINTILNLSKAPLFIGSGSTFSLWIRYLGQMSSISFKNQIKEKVLLDENKFEIEVEKEIPPEYKLNIKKILK